MTSATMNSSGRYSTVASPQLEDANLKIDKLLATEEHPFKITSLAFCDQLDMLIVGLSNGQIVTYTFEIESYVATSDSES